MLIFAVSLAKLTTFVAPSNKLNVVDVVFKTPLLARTSSEKVAMPVTPRVEVNVVAPVTFKVLFKTVFKYELKVPAVATAPRLTFVVDPATPAVPKFIVFVAPEIVAPLE